MSEEFEGLNEILKASGFQIVPVEEIINLLAKMEEYVCEQTGVSVDELYVLVDKLEDLVGSDEAAMMSLDEIVSWVNVLKQQ